MRSCCMLRLGRGGAAIFASVIGPHRIPTEYAGAAPQSRDFRFEHPAKGAHPHAPPRYPPGLGASGEGTH
jgi:hypothetical protein